jgi:hypothetical protein
MKYFSIFIHHLPYNKSILTFQWYLTDTIQTTGNVLSKVALHNKPMKASSTGIVRQGKLNISNTEMIMD